MDNQWIGYEMTTDEGSLLCLFNVGAGDIAPDEARPHCVRLRLTFQDKGEEGMGAQDERDEFESRLEMIDPQLDKLKAVHIATLRGQGCFDSIYYLPEQSGDAFAKAAEKACKGCALEIEGGPDPEWEIFESLHPSEEEVAFYYDGVILNEMGEDGDTPDAPRSVEHCLLLPDDAAAEVVIAKAGKAGFALDERENTDDELAVQLVLTKEHPATLEAISAERQTLTEIANASGGVYDGWASPIVK
ncbi:MAG: DUF695 domain-containing protein [Phycisphaerales bacterium]|nr:DUF695 domain-containing protein [Phycisphaerales bacterium]